jgi:sulfur carrier protein
MIAILVNGQPHDAPENQTLLQLLGVLNLPTHGVAVAINSAITSTSMYGEQILREGDKVEIIRAVGGG